MQNDNLKLSKMENNLCVGGRVGIDQKDSPQIA